MIRTVLIVIATVLILLSAFSVDGPDVGDHRVSLFVLGLAFFVLSFAAWDEIRAHRRP